MAALAMRRLRQEVQLGGMLAVGYPRATRFGFLDVACVVNKLLGVVSYSTC
jgi:hypothetical protein